MADRTLSIAIGALLVLAAINAELSRDSTSRGPEEWGDK